MRCQHCDNEATEGRYCLPCYSEECNRLIAELKSDRHITPKRIEADRVRAINTLRDGQVFRLRPIPEPSLN